MLSNMKSIKTLQVPDFVWKSQFEPGAELGFLVQPHFMTTVEETTWRAKYLFTKKIITENHKIAANLKRRWDLSADLIHKIRDTRNCEEANIYDVEPDALTDRFGFNVDRDQVLVCQSLPQRITDANGSFRSTGVKIQADGCLKRLVAKGMYVSYIGSGKLRFVSGFRFLPGGEKLGLINAEDEEYVQLHTPTSYSSTLVMWVATSEYGVRGISVAPLGIDYAFERYDDVYVNRKMLKTNSSGIEIEKFVITVGLSEVTSLCIYSKNFINGGDLERQEWFIQRYSWSPTIPPTFSKYPIDVNHDIFCGNLNYITEQARREAAALDHIMFNERPVIRFTCWLGSNSEIYGIGILVEGEDKPLVMGKTTEFSTDAALEKGEVITSLDIFLGGRECLPVGVSLNTSRGVAFHFIIPNLADAPRKHSLEARSRTEIVGLFAGFTRAFSKTPLSQLLALGIITSLVKGPSTVEEDRGSRKFPSNPQLRLWNEATDGPCPRDILWNSQQHLGYFISTAPVANCKLLECYVQDNHHGYRITGICVSYGKEPDSLQQAPMVLGRLSSAATKTIFEIESDRGEYIVAADVYIKSIKMSSTVEPPLAVTGIVFWTSSRRKISCGKCQAEYASKVLPLRTSIEEDFILKWIYSTNIDYLTNVKDI
ncbi:hypothetical protein TWF481_010276 [Arthrobotrys musiformis]|uniref:Uncharacterized protein n=1 Tax=Arthrobotrys musiformis TaxID=47236 RepID=A0AAV9W1H7_9PEZI